MQNPPDFPSEVTCEICLGVAHLDTIRYFTRIPIPTRGVGVEITQVLPGNVQFLLPGYAPERMLPDPTDSVESPIFLVSLRPNIRSQWRRFMELNLLPYNSMDAHFYLSLTFPAEGPQGNKIDPNGMIHDLTGWRVDAGWEYIVEDLIPQFYPGFSGIGRGGVRPVGQAGESRMFEIWRDENPMAPGVPVLKIRRLNQPERVHDNHRTGIFLPMEDPEGYRDPFEECICEHLAEIRGERFVRRALGTHKAEPEIMASMRYSVKPAPTDWVPVRVALRWDPSVDPATSEPDLRWGFSVTADNNATNYRLKHWYDLQVLPMVQRLRTFNVCGVGLEAAEITDMYCEACNSGDWKTRMYDVKGWREVMQDLTDGPRANWPAYLDLHVCRAADRTLEFMGMNNEQGDFIGAFQAGQAIRDGRR